MGKQSFYIDKGAYTNLLTGIDSLHTTERKGNLSDFQAHADHTWLADTVVMEQRTYLQGEWQVELLVVSIHNPLKFLKQRLCAHPCSELAANNWRRDLSMAIGQMNFCSN